MSEHVPVELRAPRGARLMEIDWEDGHTSLLPHDLLRGFCPCAHCQGHSGPVRYRPSSAEDPKRLELGAIEEVGSYALRLAWADGHATGIYTFKFLRALCDCSACRKPDPRAVTYER